jgi:hypothetical protein
MACIVIEAHYAGTVTVTTCTLNFPASVLTRTPRPGLGTPGDAHDLP